jgi:hypothetical protein
MITLHLGSVATAISKLNISGVPIKDTNQIFVSGKVLLPVLAPKPDGYITNIKPIVDTFGTMGSEQMTVQYVLTYRYYHAAIGQSLSFGTYQVMITNIVTIMNAVMNNDTVKGATNLRFNGIPIIGPVTDPSGNVYHGCDIGIWIEEYI